jgi:Zn-dependent M28 family amino/carboxypeptidase
VGSWAKEQRMLPRPQGAPQPLGFRGWITDSAATALLHQAGLDLGELRRRAATRSFRPVPTGITVDVAFRNRVEHLESENVVGVVPGSDPQLRNEYVAYTAHWDHLGIGPKVDGDSIYNGALDNASGVADVLAIARAAAHAAQPPARSQLFILVTAEESGLLGSDYFANHPTVPLPSIIANLNIDGGNLLGRSRDFRVLGDTKSSLGTAFASMIQPRGWRITADEHPERGAFYRSDHFSFAKVGVPSASIAAGTDFEGRPAGWGVEQEEDYTSHRYHQPSDEYRTDFDLTGAVQLAETVYDFGQWLANQPTRPEWLPTAEFHRPAP